MSPEPIQLTVYSSRVPNLTLVDMPGARRRHDQPVVRRCFLMTNAACPGRGCKLTSLAGARQG